MHYADFASSEVQWPHRVALMGMVIRQNAHSFVLGSAEGTSSSRFIRLMALISKNTATATIKKLMTELRNTDDSEYMVLALQLYDVYRKSVVSGNFAKTVI